MRQGVINQSENSKAFAHRTIYATLICLVMISSDGFAQIEEALPYADDAALIEEEDAGEPAGDDPLMNQQDFDALLMRPAYYGSRYQGSSVADILTGPSAPGQRMGEGNFMLGPVSAQIYAGFGVEYNSNVTLSSEPIADIALIPEIGLQFLWPLTEYNQISAQVGFQYTEYLIHPDLSSGGPTLEPGTEIEFRAKSGDFTFTLYEAPSVERNAGNDPGLSDVARFGQFQNAAGFTVQWNLNRLLFTLGYERLDFFSITGTFNSLNGNSNSVLAGAFYELTPTTSVGLRANASNTSYSGNALNDNSSILVAGVLQTRLSRSTNAFFEGGIQSFVFSDNGTQIDELDSTTQQTNISGTLGGGNFLGPYLRLGVTNVLNAYLSHVLIAGYDTSASSVANYSNSANVSYALNWRTNRWLTMSLAAGYSIGRISGEGGGTYSSITPSIGASFKIFKNWSLSVEYSIAAQDSTYGQSYFQQIATFATQYQF